MHWAVQFYSVYDQLDLELLLSMFADDVEVSLGAEPPVRGLGAVGPWYAGFLEQMSAVEHRIHNVWEVDDATAIVEFAALGRWTAGESFKLDCVSILRQSDDKIKGVRTYVDRSHS